MTVAEVNAEGFRDAMAQLPGPVSVITAQAGSRPHGTTVSAVISLSLTPPMVLVSLDRRSDLLAIIADTRTFGVNVLSASQIDLALRFAGKGAGKFDGVACDLVDGAPRLPDTSAWLRCTVSDLVDGGDHVVVLGAVTGADSAPVTPLIYHARTFGTHTPLTCWH
ncbi:MAG: flavin reductase family protein [Mycobacterium sp.]